MRLSSESSSTVFDVLTPWVGWKSEAAGHQHQNMDKPQYPEDLMIEIIHKFAEIEVEREEWLRLRLVNSMF